MKSRRKKLRLRKEIECALPLPVSLAPEGLLPLLQDVDSEIFQLHIMCFDEESPRYYSRKLYGILKDIEVKDEELRDYLLKRLRAYRQELEERILETRICFVPLGRSSGDESYYNYRYHKHDHDYERRKRKRIQRERAKLGPRPPKFVDAEDRELETLEEERIPHNKGFKEGWVPTRQRYWRPSNNNWKRHRHTQYVPL